MEGLLKRAKTDERRRELEEQLEGPPFPWCGRHLWKWFGELGRERDYAGMGDPLPLKARDIRGWMSLYHRRPTPQELEVLRDLDTLWLNTRAEARGKE